VISLSTDPFDELAKQIYKETKEFAVRYARVPGVFVHVDRERCIGCRKCVKEGYCRFGAISIADKKATVNERRCRGCMRCTHLCPKSAFVIEVRPPPSIQDALRDIDNDLSRHLK